jgi:hypothetical protein
MMWEVYDARKGRAQSPYGESEARQLVRQLNEYVAINNGIPRSVVERSVINGPFFARPMGGKRRRLSVASR